MGEKRLWAIALGLTVGLLAAAQPVEAQAYRFDVGVFGGGSWFSNTLEDEHLNLEDNKARYKAGWVSGFQAGVWFTPRIGLRADLAYTERPFVLTEEEVFTEAGDDVLRDDINLWGLSGDLLIRFREPNTQWVGREFLPYVALGLGAQITNPAEDTQVEDEDGALFGTNDAAFLIAHKTTLMGLVGVGADLRLSPNFAVRMEVNDRIWDPAIFPLNFSGETFTRAEGDEDVGKVTHWVSGQVGLHLLGGLQAPPQVVVTPPPPAPPAAPQPPPPPRVDAIQVCVVDPSAPGGLRMVSAMYRHETRDTVVMAAGDTVAFSTEVPEGVTLAPSATWYVQGQPLVFEFGTAPRRVEFLTVGTARVVPASDLAFLGYMEGVPVYASRSDVSMVQEEWNEMVAAGGEGDLDDLLRENRELRNAFNNIQVLYVPVQPIGCVFQAVQRQEEVLKGGK